MPNDIKLEDIAVSNLALYLSTCDFTALHTVTSCHAIRLLYPYLDEACQLEAIKHYWFSIVAAYATIGAPLVKPLDAVDTHVDGSIEVIKEALRDGLDDHDIKIAYTAICEAQHYNDDRFLLAAKFAQKY